jgi:EAL domain-containing protein (putative c-di-GMP-specific phosphodiesterase class I)
LEALSRWEDANLPGLGPAEFIPVAEQMGTIEAITHGLLKSAAAEAASWPSEVLLSFNMSAIPLCSPGYGKRLLALINELAFDCSRLQLEVTETALLNDLALAGENLRLLRSHGTKIVLDDFGAGYASVSYLQEIEFDAIKLDGSLIRGTGPNSEKLLRGVLDLCASMGVPCVAEHIETREQLDLLTANGCRDGQGFYLSPPLTATQARVLARAASPTAHAHAIRAA